MGLRKASPPITANQPRSLPATSIGRPFKCEPRDHAVSRLWLGAPSKKNMTKQSLKILLLTATFWMLGPGVFAGQVLAQQQTTASNATSGQDDSVQTSASHHYQSPAERAKDALLITEVKMGLAKDGVAGDYPVAVDCDHGKIRLSGVIGSAEDAQHAGDIAAAAPGVVAVTNQLTWRK